MAERSDLIRQDIERTRQQMSETVDALGYKADVPGRTRDWVGEKKQTVTSAVSGAAGRVSDMTPDRAAARRRAGRLKTTAERNPLGLAIAGAAAGFLAGMLAPGTEAENEKLGPQADRLKQAAADAGSEAIERGKQVAQDVAEQAVETARERGREEGAELSSHVQDRVGSDPTS